MSLLVGIATSLATGAASAIGTYLVTKGIDAISKLSHRKDHRRRIIYNEYSEPGTVKYQPYEEEDTSG